MDDKRQLLKQIGWPDELIEQCLSPRDNLTLELPQPQYHVLIGSEQDVTNFVMSLRTPTTSDPTNS
jgi:hypothetical protein